MQNTLLNVPYHNFAVRSLGKQVQIVPYHSRMVRTPQGYILNVPYHAIVVQNV